MIPLSKTLLVSIVFFVCLCLRITTSQIDDGTCGIHQPPLATFPCQHGADCMNGTCYCTPGFTDIICGFHWENCMCIQCINGNMTNADQPEVVPHWCECNPGWKGRNCDICSQIETCMNLFPDYDNPECDTSPVVIKNKIIDCNITDPFFNVYFPEAEISFQIHAEGLNETRGEIEFQAWIMSGEPAYHKEYFYCLLSDCRFEGGDIEAQYICETTKCGLTGWVWANSFVKAMIEGLSGTSYLKCKASETSDPMACVIYQKGLDQLFGDIAAVCVTGECTATPRPAIEQPFNPRSVIVVSCLCVIIIIVVAISMYLYRRHQNRYAKFKGRPSTTFVDLHEALSFSNDTLFFENICYHLGDKEIIQNVSGLARPGEVLALIGGSGAGKTTLLDILAQRTKMGKVEGNITVNGEPISPTFSRITSYVDQEPAAIGTQTVREILLTAANLRLPETVTTDQKKMRIMALVTELGIEHILDRKYGEEGRRGISGGEKRRVQIACQLVTGPSIIFLDEPTSGLDSFNALAVCRFLKDYARKKNRTVIMSIHQPRSDIFHTFDKLMVLAEGRLIYFGKTQQAKYHFESLGYQCPPDFNPADFILDVSMGEKDTPDVLENEFMKTEGYLHMIEAVQNQDAEITSISSYGSISSKGYKKLSQSDLPDGYSDRYATSFFTQIFVLSNRAFSDTYRYPLLLWLHVGFGILSGGLMGLFFFNLTYDFAGTQNRIGLLLFLLIVLAFASMSSIGFISREREVFVQERASGCYHPAAYYIVKILFDLLPLRILPTLLLGSLVYILTGLKKEWVAYGFFIAVIVLFSITTTLICISIATGIRNLALANLISIITLLFFMLFQGAMINFEALPPYIHWMTFLSPFRFGLNSLLVNELDGLSIWFDPIEDMEPTWISGRLVLSMFGFKPEWAYTVDIYALLTMSFCWFFISMTSLILFVKEKR